MKDQVTIFLSEKVYLQTVCVILQKYIFTKSSANEYMLKELKVHIEIHIHKVVLVYVVKNKKK